MEIRFSPKQHFLPRFETGHLSVVKVFIKTVNMKVIFFFFGDGLGT
jgi:hypothetical protein